MSFLQQALIFLVALKMVALFAIGRWAFRSRAP
jgi:hypothetical protein